MKGDKNWTGKEFSLNKIHDCVGRAGNTWLAMQDRVTANSDQCVTLINCHQRLSSFDPALY